MADNCIFCRQDNLKIILKNNTCFAIKDKHPVSKDHYLVIPFAHRENYFSLTREEILDSFQLLEDLRQEICAKDALVNGFNIGMNCGKSAGQSVFHCHIHLIPRRGGDVQSPRGGVRHIIPGKGDY